MPPVADANVSVQGVDVDVSAVVDLYLQMNGCDRPEKPGQVDLPGSPGVTERVLGFWGPNDNAWGLYDQLPVLAARGGFLAGDTLDGFLDALPGLAAAPAVELSLRTEEQETRERIAETLEALRRDADLRARYVELVRDAAQGVKPTWEERLPVLRARGEWFRERLADGEDLTNLLPPRTLAMRSRYRGLLEDGIRRGRVLLVPTMGTDIIFDLPGVLLVGDRVTAANPVEAARHRTAKLAERLRALGDPTRLAIAAYLSQQPGSVSSLARAFGLAQPTVSAHVRSLRAAGLLDSTRSHGMTEFRLAEPRLRRLFEEVGEALFGEE